MAAISCGGNFGGSNLVTAILAAEILDGGNLVATTILSSGNFSGGNSSGRKFAGRNLLAEIIDHGNLLAAALGGDNS